MSTGMPKTHFHSYLHNLVKKRKELKRRLSFRPLCLYYYYYQVQHIWLVKFSGTARFVQFAVFLAENLFKSGFIKLMRFIGIT